MTCELKFSLQNLKEQFPFSNLNIVFGCGGNRDIEKRPLMGTIANKYCDKVYLTDDNPRDENPNKIRLFTLRSFGESFYHSITDSSLEYGYIAS